MNYTLKHELDTMLFHLDGVQMASEFDVQLDVLHAMFKNKGIKQNSKIIFFIK